MESTIPAKVPTGKTLIGCCNCRDCPFSSASRPVDQGPLGPYQTLFPGSRLISDFEWVKAPGYFFCLCFHAPRLIALRGKDRNEETSKTENEREILMRRACARTLSPRSFLLLKHSLQPTPSPHPARSADWPHGLCLALAPCIPGSNSRLSAGKPHEKPVRVCCCLGGQNKI